MGAIKGAHVCPFLSHFVRVGLVPVHMLWPVPCWEGEGKDILWHAMQLQIFSRRFVFANLAAPPRFSGIAS